MTLPILGTALVLLWVHVLWRRTQAVHRHAQDRWVWVRQAVENLPTSPIGRLNLVSWMIEAGLVKDPATIRALLDTGCVAVKR